jgi:hypothetical protein
MIITHLVIPPKESQILEDPFSVLLALIVGLKVLGQICVDGGQPRSANLVYPIRKSRCSLQTIISPLYGKRKDLQCERWDH